MSATKHRRLNGSVRPGYAKRLAARAIQRGESEKAQADLARQYAEEDAAKAVAS